MVILDRAIAANKQGTKTIFQSQIEILKFLKSLSDHNSKEYFAAVAEVPDYARILLRAYHPVNVAVTAYVLMMLQDYAWKVEESVSVVEAMEAWKEETGAKSMLEAFAQCIYETDNILMCCYNLRFINEILISIVDDEEKARFEENLREIRYELLIEDIKSKLQENFYRIENCSFISVNQKIYKHATQTQPAKDMLAPAMMNRSTLNLDSLQQHLLVHLLEGNELEQDSEEDDDENYLTVYLVETDKKGFNKFIFDTFSEIQHYYKYSLILDECGEGDLQVVGEEEVGKLKKYGLTIEEYTKRIKGSCTKNNCEEIMLTCLKTMQYFDKNEWKQLEILLAQDLKNTKTAGADQENLRKQL